MSWFRLDDQFPRHPKVLQCSAETMWLYVAAGCYCAQYLTDGFFPKRAIPGMTTSRKWEVNAATLVRVGLWHEVDDETFEVHDYLEYNPSREFVESERLRKSMAGAKGAAKRWHGTSDATAMAPAIAEGTAAAMHPAPTHPLKENGRRKRQPPKDFSPTEEHQTFAKASGLDLDREREDWLCWCEAHGKTYQSLNAGFSTWLRHAVEYGRGKTNSRRPRTDFDALQ